MNVTSTIKQYITDNGIKQNFVAEKAGISAELLRRSLDGKRKMQADEFLAVCNVLSLDFDYFRKSDSQPGERSEGGDDSKRGEKSNAS